MKFQMSLPGKKSSRSSWYRHISVCLAIASCMLILFILSSPAHAWPGDLVEAWSSPELYDTTSLAWGDWDNDGDLDLAEGNDGDFNQVYRNENGGLTLAWSSPESDNTTSVAWGDWDGDLDLDLAVGNGNQPNRIYRNDGGILTLAWSSTESDDTRSVAWGDWDGDLDLDLVVGNGDQPNRIYRNEGVSLTLAWSSPESDDTRSVAWGDWDGDTDLDLAVGNSGQPNRIYRNDGGMLTLDWSSPESDDTRSVAWGDWDGDTDLDLAVGNWNQPNRIYRNDGGSLALDWSSPEEDTTQSVAWGDWDGDTDLDLAVGNAYQPSQIYNNTAAGFSVGWFSPEVDNTRSVAWADWDDDGDLDLAVGNALVNRVYTNGGGSVSLAWSATQPDNSYSVAWGDWDGDGDLDLAVGNYIQPNQVFENDGAGNLALVWSSSGSEATRSVAWGDWDNDGDLDLAVGNLFDPCQVYRNDGGALTLAWSAPLSEATTYVAWGDWDNDGDLDLAVGNADTANRVYQNDGDDLVLAWSAPQAESTISMDWGDWDNDGDLDLAVANVNHSNRVYRNDGGDLILAWSSTLWENTYEVAWGDWDNDGDLDLAVGNGYQSTRVYRNDGGNLTPAWSMPPTNSADKVAWGDWDGDGDLDLAVGTWSQPNYVFQNAAGDLALAWTSTEVELTTQVAWADWDNDGDLDLIASNRDAPNRIYRNGGGPLTLSWSSMETERTTSLAWGDWDNDGDLDLAVGNDSAGANQVYRNDAGWFVSIWDSFETDETAGLAWGDWDNDGDLDLAVGNSGQPNRIYRNDGGTMLLAWSSPETDSTTGLAWADWDGDGDLDLAVGSSGQPNRIYRNDGGTMVLAWSSPESDNTTSVAWGDWDGDGDLDLAVGNSNQPNRIYRNDGGVLILAWSSPEIADTQSVAWGDWDQDGNLDLAVGNWVQSNQIYRNDGGGLTLAWSSMETESTRSVAWGDWDNDGDLDLAVGNYFYPSRVYRNTGGSLAIAWSLPEGQLVNSVAWGDMDGDSDLDLAVGGDSDGSGGNVARNWVLRNRTADGWTPIASTARISGPARAQAPLFASAEVFVGPTLPITYTLVDREGNAVRYVEAYYSLDGGSQWQPAVATSGTITSNLYASPAGSVYTYTWDIHGSDLFGKSDNAVFRLDIYQGFDRPGPYQRAFLSNRTLPFRVRGSQVRVLSGTVPISGALVYRLPAGSDGLYEPYQDNAGRPFRTDALGYLRGRGEVAPGDRLVALLPIALLTGTESYTLCYTSAAPTPSGIDSYTVTTFGVQTLTVSSDYPLVLFNLIVSLEWDARSDPTFIEQLVFDLKRTSGLLYDWTDGQAALGSIEVYHDRGNWLDAHVRVYASNQVRPSAAQGGLVSQVVTDTVALTLTYWPGQVHMGAVWNRYGDPGSTGEDWPRGLAHELGHYALFLDDNYLGFDQEGLLIPIEGCPGAMSDPYREDAFYDEFHPDQDWLPACADTLSHQATGRSDWSTMATFYPWFNEPVTDTNSGPGTLPLAVTQIQVVEPVTPSQAIELPIFYLVQDGGSVQPGGGARALLFQGTDGLSGRLVDLGRPTLDYVLARGAAPGDRLCVYDLEQARLGCEEIVDGDEHVELVAVSAWQPDLVISPVNSRTVTLTVTNVPAGLDLWARLFPVDDPATEAILLVETAGGYSATLQAESPALNGYLHVWVQEPDPRREIVTDYALGGNPGAMRGRWGAMRGRWGAMRGRWAPVLSSDGQVIIFGRDLEFQEGEFLTLHAATIIPSPLPWATVVGSAYRLAVSANAPDLSGASISVTYLGNAVPPGEEAWLRIYFWDGASWQQLPTSLDLYRNNASAPVQGPGLYVLMSSIEIPLYAPGWNLFAYPVQATRPVTETLLSIEGYYSTVYGHVVTDTLDPWKVYDVGAPSWVNDLHALRFGRGYWISVTEAITLRLRGISALPVYPERMPPTPPATYYGPVSGGGGMAVGQFTPVTGMTLTAWIDGHLCGQGLLIEPAGYGIAYVVDVMADDWGQYAGCGAPGRELLFRIGDHLMVPPARWDNGRVREHALSPSSVFRIYLPLVLRAGGR